MKTMIEISTAAVSPDSHQTARPVPSLRLPVTAANRALLRWLRAAESSAWEAGQVYRRGSSSGHSGASTHPHA